MSTPTPRDLAAWMVGVMKRITALERSQSAPAQNPLSELWTGSLVMRASDTIMLPFPVSSMQTGIILVWARYDTAGAADYQDTFTYQYVPRWHVDHAPTGSSYGTGHLVMNNTSVEVYKYVYVKDDRVIGNDNNMTAPNDGRHLRAILAW